MDKFEVVIVGAGPAGLRCAEVLGKSGKKVLLLEKNQVIGPKVCAGGLITGSFEQLGIGREVVEHEFREIVLCTPLAKNRVKRKESIVYTVDRQDLGQWQLKQLERGNVTVRTSARVTAINKDNLVINGTEMVGFDYLVGADGAQSIVRSHLGLETSRFLTAIQYILPTSEYKDIEIHFSSKLFDYFYGWVFPHKDYVSIGCGCNPKTFPVNRLVEEFNAWLKARKINVESGEFQSFMINCDYRGYKFGNVYLAGDAAGLASYLSGEGIYEALISGEEVAREIISPSYHSLKIEELVARKKDHDRISSILERSVIFRNLIFELNSLFMRFNKYSGRIFRKM